MGKAKPDLTGLGIILILIAIYVVFVYHNPTVAIILMGIGFLIGYYSPGGIR